MNKSNLNSCPDYLREFLVYMETIKNRSPKTVDGYYVELRSFIRYLMLKNNLVPKDTEYSEIDISGAGFDLIKNATKLDAMAIRSFYKYLTVSSGKLLENPMLNLETPKLKKTLPKYLTLEQALELLTHIETNLTERDFCIITLFLNCGMRLSELCGINLSDIHDNRLKLLGKGNKERVVYLNNSCLNAINNYLAVLNSGTKIKRVDKDALFLNRSGKRIGARSVELIVEKCLKQAGLEGMGISPHKLRHTAATLLYQDAGVDIRVLKELLGHESLSTTEIYTHVSNKQIEEASKKSPLGNVKPAKAAKKSDNG